MPSPNQQILGLAHEHDSGVALITDGAMPAAANEERFNRKKFTTELPEQSLNWLAKHGGLDATRVSDIALGSRLHVEGSWWEGSKLLNTAYEILNVTKLDRLLFGTVLGCRFVTAVMRTIHQPKRMNKLRAFLTKHGLGQAAIHAYDHHECHAASAYIGSGYQKALVITLDAQGDGDCSRVYTAQDGQMTLHQQVPFFHSPGNYYEYVTHILGFKPGREGKVTGLAARGNAEKTFPIFSSRLSYEATNKTFRNHGGFRLPEIRFLNEQLKAFSREDVAAGIQRHLETTVSAYVRDQIALHGDEQIDLVLAGGVFANVRLNQCLAELPNVRHVYIFPHMGDGGLAAGAALAHCLRHKIPCRAIETAYLGPDIEETEAEQVLRQYNLSFDKPADLPRAIAECLAADCVVAVCRGRMEFGPRALGNRTILYKTDDPTVNDWLNVFLRRSEFMPFAPILLEEDMETYFQGAIEQSRHAAQYMTITLQATEQGRREAPAIVHVDGTARPQLVTKTSNPFIRDVLTRYHEQTHRRVLVNTSFNMHEEPIVCSPEDAVRAFLDGRLDVLALGPFLIKNPNPRENAPALLSQK